MTLTQAAKFTKISVVFFVILILASFTGFFGYRIWYANYLASIPPVEEKADPKFGLLPRPNFPESEISSSNYSYSIDTITGNLPSMQKLAKVYIIPPTIASLLAGEKSQTLAEKFGLNPQPEILSSNSYKYTSSASSLIANLDSGNFTYQKEATAVAESVIQDPEETLIGNFKSVLEKLGLLKDELSGSTKVVFLDSENKTAQVSVWPANIDNLSILTPSPTKSLVSGVFTNSALDLANYLSLGYTFWPVDLSSFATYPIKTSQQAFEDLQNGKGVILTQPPTPQVSIVNVSMSYYQTPSYTPYLQPIYVFEGPNFLAYVPAVTEEYLTAPK